MDEELTATGEEFTLPVSGETVTLRGLTGFEVMLARKGANGDEIIVNTRSLSMSSGMSEKSALAWVKKKLAGDFDFVMNKIQELSGMSEGAGKSPVPEIRD